MLESAPKSEKSYAMEMRDSHPEKMNELENLVRAFSQKVLLEGESLTEKEVSLVANYVANKTKRTLETVTLPEEFNKVIEETLYEGIDMRLKLKKEGFMDRFVQ